MAAPTLYFVAGSHFDLGWCGSIAETLQYGDEIIKTAIDFITGDHPDYRFTVEYALFMKHFLDRHPEYQDRVKALCDSGHLEVCATWTGMMDSILNGETAIRNILLARRWLREALGVEERTAQLTDCPGHTNQLPQFLARCGVKHLAFSRYSPPSPIFWWIALDGSKVLATSHDFGLYQGIMKGPGGGASYGWGLVLDQPWEELVRTLSEQVARFKPLTPGSYWLMSSEVDLRHANPEALKAIRKWSELHGDVAAIEVATVSQYFEAVQTEELPTYTGEAPYEFYTIPAFEVAAFMKGRQAENALMAAETFSSWQQALGLGTPNWQSLEDGWEKLSYPHDHNVGGMHGEINDWVREHCAEHAYVAAWNAIEEATQAMTLRVDFRQEGTPFTVWNPLSWERDEVVRTYLEFRKTNLKGLRLTDATGHALAAQVLDIVERQGVSRVTFAFRATVPPVGYTTIYATPTNGGADSAAPAAAVTPAAITSSDFEIATDRQGITSLKWLPHAVDFAASGRYSFGALVALEDVAIDVCEELTGKEWVAAWRDEFELVEAGPVLARVRRRGTLMESPVQLDLVFQAGLPYLDAEVTIDWEGRFNTQVRWLLPFNVPSGKITYETPYGHTTMPDGELPNTYRGTGGRFVQRWVDVSSNQLGITVATDSGCASLDGTNVAFVLLRNTFSCGTPCLTFPQLGHHTFRFRILPHLGGWRESLAFRTGWELNNPLWLDRYTLSWPMVPVKGEQCLLQSDSFCRIDADNAVITTIKRTFDGAAYAVRVVEMAGKSGAATLTFQRPLTSAAEVNLMEEEAAPLSFDGKELSVSLLPCGIHTFRVEFAV